MTKLKLKKVAEVQSYIDWVETAIHSDDDSQFQTYGSAKDLQKFIQNFVEECNADYSVDSIRVVRSNMTLEVKITLDPFTDSPIPVSICFDPHISEALSQDVDYLENQLY